MKLLGVFVGLLALMPVISHAQDFVGFNKRINVFDSHYEKAGRSTTVTGYTSKNRKSANLVVFKCEQEERHLEILNKDRVALSTYFFQTVDKCLRAANLAVKHPLEIAVDDSDHMVRTVSQAKPAEKAPAAVQVEEKSEVVPAENKPNCIPAWQCSP
jgi:hypothetical protein